MKLAVVTTVLSLSLLFVCTHATNDPAMPATARESMIDGKMIGTCKTRAKIRKAIKCFCAASLRGRLTVSAGRFRSQCPALFGGSQELARANIGKNCRGYWKVTSAGRMIRASKLVKTYNRIVTRCAIEYLDIAEL